MRESEFGLMAFAWVLGFSVLALLGISDLQLLALGGVAMIVISQCMFWILRVLGLMSPAPGKKRR